MLSLRRRIVLTAVYTLVFLIIGVLLINTARSLFVSITQSHRSPNPSAPAAIPRFESPRSADSTDPNTANHQVSALGPAEPRLLSPPSVALPIKELQVLPDEAGDLKLPEFDSVSGSIEPVAYLNPLRSDRNSETGATFTLEDTPGSGNSFRIADRNTHYSRFTEEATKFSLGDLTIQDQHGLHADETARRAPVAETATSFMLSDTSDEIDRPDERRLTKDAAKSSTPATRSSTSSQPEARPHSSKPALEPPKVAAVDARAATALPHRVAAAVLAKPVPPVAEATHPAATAPPNGGTGTVLPKPVSPVVETTNPVVQTRRSPSPKRIPPPTISDDPDNVDDRGEVSVLAKTSSQVHQVSRLQPTESPRAPDEKQGKAGSAIDSKQTLGEAPEPVEPQFLRQETILLEPGERQIEVTLQYLNHSSDSTLAELQGGILSIGEVRRRQRLLLVPIECRMGITPQSQGFINVPFGWSSSEFVFNGRDEFSNTGGLGDISAGLTEILVEGSNVLPDILVSYSFSAPTGDSDFATSLSAPGSSLGEGFWSLTGAFTCLQTFDPVVVFYGGGYRHRFEHTFDNDISVEPGAQVFYRFGIGFAINPNVTISGSFTGFYTEESTVNGVRLVGDIQEPMQIRLAATITDDKKSKDKSSDKTIFEPFVAFGLTESAADAVIGISRTQ